MSEERFRAMVVAMDVGVLETDRLGHVIFMNPAAEALLGWTEAELRGRELHEVLHAWGADHRPRTCTSCPMLVAIRSHQRYRTGDDVCARKDGAVVRSSVVVTPIETAGDDAGHVVVIEQARHCGSSARDHRRLEHLLEMLPVPVVVAESGRETVSWANRAAERLLRTPRERITVGPGPSARYELRRPDGILYTRESLPLSRTLDYGEEVVGQEVVLVWPDGQAQHLLVSSAPLHDEQGRVTEAVVAFEDISRLKEYEQLREEFVSVIAHDLRAPLQVISGYAQFLESLPDAQQVSQREQRAVGAIRTSTVRLTRMVGDLLDASRIVARRLRLERSEVALPALVRGTVEQLHDLLKEHPVRIDVRDEIPTVTADASRIEQVLTNLLTNAAKYSSEGTPIEIVVDRRDREVTVSVRDHGVGIAVWEIPHLFERFYRTPAARRAEREGLGVGLYIVRGLVEAHGGRVWVESQMGLGSTFTFTLPVSADVRSGAIPSVICSK